MRTVSQSLSRQRLGSSDLEITRVGFGARAIGGVVFRFTLSIGMLTLTGTSDPEHMKLDLASRELALTPDEVREIESLAGWVYAQ